MLGLRTASSREEGAGTRVANGVLKMLSRSACCWLLSAAAVEPRFRFLFRPLLTTVNSVSECENMGDLERSRSLEEEGAPEEGSDLFWPPKAASPTADLALTLGEVVVVAMIVVSTVVVVSEAVEVSGRG